MSCKNRSVLWFDEGQTINKAGCVLIMCLMLFQRYLPREVDPLVYNMSHEDPGSVSYSEIGGLSEQIRELREVQPRLSRSLSNGITQDTNFWICMVELCLEGFCFG